MANGRVGDEALAGMRPVGAGDSRFLGPCLCPGPWGRTLRSAFSSDR